MDTVITIIEVYKPEVTRLATLVGIIKSLTGLTIGYQIIIEQDTSKHSATGCVSSLSLAVLGVRHAALIKDNSLMCTHILQMIVDAINLAVYFYHSNNKWKDVIEPLSKGFCAVLAGLGYTQVEDPNRVAVRFGGCLGALSVITLASPLAKLSQVVKESDTTTLTIIITMLSMIASLLWVLVALTVNNQAMLVQNALGLLLNAIHIAVHILYHK